MANLPRKIYLDEDGWLHTVTSDKARTSYLACVIDTASKGMGMWPHVDLEWRTTFDEAQADLDKLAAANGWKLLTPYIMKRSVL